MTRALAVLLSAAAALATTRALADATAQAAPLEPAPADPRQAVDFDVTGGAMYESLYGIPSYFGGGSIALGRDLDSHAWRLRAGYARGRTEYGLTLERGSFGFEIVGVVGPFRIGGAADLVYFALTRVTDGTTLDSFGLGLALPASFDVARIGDGALYVELRPNLDLFAHIAFEGAALSLGYRL